MTWKTIIGRIIQLPGQLLLLGSFIGSIYAAYNHISNINWLTPVILGCIFVLYLIGLLMIAYDDEVVVEQQEVINKR